MKLTREIFSFSKKNTQVYITPNWINLSKDESSIQLIDEEKEKYVALKSEKRNHFDFLRPLKKKELFDIDILLFILKIEFVLVSLLFTISTLS